MNQTTASKLPIISVTGTKGKTTTVSVIADVLHAMGKSTLKVDTTGHFVNGERKSTLEDSKKAWSLVPSVCPGRYLYEAHLNPESFTDGVAVLECSLGCSALSGLGYRYHDVGVFLNVFEDHLGSSDRIQSKEDIAKAKQFIFSRIPNDGWAVFNADDSLVCDRLEAIKSTNVHLLPFGFEFSNFNITEHLNTGGHALTCKDGKVILLTKDSEKVLFEVSAIPWTFNGNFQPSLWNLLSAAGAVHAFFGGEYDASALKAAFESVRLDKYGGRLTVLQAKNGATIIADYAHEKVSLAQVAQLARSINKEGSVIGVVRLAHDRTDELMRETGRVVGKSFDKLVVYEKIDGYWRKPINTNSARFPQVIGRTSEIFTAGIAEINQQVMRILREDEALIYAAEITGPNDVVVVIVNDNIERSIEFIQKSFEAEFV